MPNQHKNHRVNHLRGIINARKGFHFMRVNWNKIYVGKVSNNDEGFVWMSPAERVSFMCELTAEVWSLRKSPYVERRPQRDITNLIKQ